LSDSDWSAVKEFYASLATLLPVNPVRYGFHLYCSLS
jgi:hypothetical protein